MANDEKQVRNDPQVAALLRVALAANLEAAMKAGGFSTLTLPKAAGVARSVVTRILAKDDKYGLPSAVVIAKLEKALGQSIWSYPLPSDV